MSSRRTLQAYVEDDCEKDQALPKTRSSAQAPTKGHPSNHHSKRTNEPSRQGPQQIEVNIRDKKIGQTTKKSAKMAYGPPYSNAWGYSQNVTSDPATYDPYYYYHAIPPSTVPAQAIPPQGIPPQMSSQPMAPQAMPPPSLQYAGMMAPAAPHSQHPGIPIPYPATTQHSQLAYRAHQAPPNAYAPPPPPPQSPTEYPPSSAGHRYRQLTVSPYHTQPPLGLSSYMHPPESPIQNGHPMSIDDSMYSQHQGPDTSGRLASRFNPRERLLQKNQDPIMRTESAYGTRDTHRSHKGLIDDDWCTGVTEGHHLRNLKSADRKAYGRASTPMPRDEYSKGYSESPPRLMRSKSLRRSSESITDPKDPYEYMSKSPAASRSRRQSVSHDHNTKSERVRFGPTSSHHRRYSCVDEDLPGSSYESKLKHANFYLEEVKGPSSRAPLTAESLRKQQKRQTSSRTTRSSASRDDSDHKRSDTSRTTRSESGNEDENMTIKVTGGSARVTVGGAQIDCNKGGAIEIKRDKVPRDSEKASSEYIGARQAIEDRERRNRYDKAPGRPRGISHSNRTSGRHRDYSSAYHT